MPAHLGQSFITPEAPGVLPHLWMVLSDPDRSSRVVIANISSRPCPSGEVFEVHRGEHPFVSHTSYLRFAEVRVTDRDGLEKLLTAGRIRPSHDLSPDLLGRMQKAVAAARVAPIEATRLLRGQGFA
jgi:hypothetical protein